MGHLPNPKIIVITGGTGSFGSAFARYLLAHTDIRIRILNRDEHKQAAMMRVNPPGSRLSYLLGDVRDLERLKVAFHGADAIVHAAALKTVPAGEQQADEFFLTNCLGTRNVIHAALSEGVGKSLLISSDKAVDPANTYGATKKIAESLFTQANVLGASRGCRFASVRGGNVWGSNGSVAERWAEAKRKGQSIFVTDAEATRFHLEMPDWVDFVASCLWALNGGEIFIPKCAAWKLGDLADEFDTDWKHAPRRHGDKQHETLIPWHECGRVADLGDGFVIDPSLELQQVMAYDSRADPDALPVPYSSDRAQLLSGAELRELVQRTVAP